MSETRSRWVAVRSVFACAFATLAFNACEKPGEKVRQEPVYIKAASGPVRPFSPAVRANGFLFLAGQIGVDSTGKIVAGGIQPETRQAMENIKAVLTQNGSSLDRVVKCTVFIGDMAEWAAMNEVYVTYFSEARRPARSATGATGLALGAKVEIECLAAD